MTDWRFASSSRARRLENEHWWFYGMSFTWQQHCHLARVVSRAGRSEQGMALALMGIGMTLLLRELEKTTVGQPESGDEIKLEI